MLIKMRHWDKKFLALIFLFWTPEVFSASAILNTPVFYNGAEFPGASGSLQVTAAASADAIQAINFTFTGTSKYVSSVSTLSTAVTGSYVHFRVKAPLVNAISVRVVDSSGQTLQFNVDRSSVHMDDLGWSTHSVLVTSSASYWGGANNGKLQGSIQQIWVNINRAVTSTAGMAYVRDLQILKSVPSSSSPVLPQATVSIQAPQFYPGSEFPGASGSLQVVPLTSGDSIQTLAFRFTGSSSYVATQMTLTTPAVASYVRFRAHAPAANGLSLRVIDSTGQTLQFNLSRTSAFTDDLGWSEFTVPVASSSAFWGGANNGILQGKISQIWIDLVKATASTSGTAYFQQVEVLDHAPSFFYPESPVAGNLVNFSFYNGAEFPGASGSLVTSALSTADNLIVMNYDFSKGGSYVSAIGTLITPATVNMASFLAQVPVGLNLGFRFVDSGGQTFQVPVTKALGTLTDTGWVQYSVALSANANHWGGANDGVIHGNIQSISIIVNAAANNNAVDILNPAGTIQFHQFRVYNEVNIFDLNDYTPVLAGMRPVGSQPMSTVDVVIHTNDSTALGIAQTMGFNHVRFDVSWAGVETTKGVYNFASYDAHVQNVLAHHLVPILILDSNNILYASSASAAVATAANQAAYANFAMQAASHFKGTGSILELYNEPNNIANWTASEFASMVKAATAKIRSVDTTVQVLSGGLANTDFTFLKALTLSSSLTGVNGVAVHPYDPGNVEVQADSLLAMNNMLQASGSSARMWITEIGSSSAWYGNGLLQASLLAQAKNEVRSLLTGWAANAPSTTIYQLLDEVATYSATDPESNFGFVTQSYTYKPAKIALDLVFSAAKNRTYQGLSIASPTSLQAMKFSASGKETVYIVWMNGPNDATSISVLNKCNTKIDMQGNAVTSSSCVVDMTGAAVPCTTESNSRLRCPISEAGGPLFVRMP